MYIMDHLNSLIVAILTVMPAFTTVRITMYCTIVLLAIEFIYQYVLYSKGRVIIFPKVLDVGILFLSILVLIIDYTVPKEDKQKYENHYVVLIYIGLFLISLVSLAINKPFTIQHAKEVVPMSIWNNPVFIRANQKMTFAWVIAFLIASMSSSIPVIRHVSEPLNVTFTYIVPVIIMLIASKYRGGH
jgi:hypothetical protein